MDGIDLHDAKGPEGMRLYAIGDVHGRLDLLTKMHSAIAEHLEREPAADWRIVHLGDYVDRGPDSAGVLDFLIAARSRDARVVALAGNHDVGFLDFLAAPDPEGLFAMNGGRQTALSYGLDIDFADAATFAVDSAALQRRVPGAHRGFLEGLAFSLSLGDFFFCHAGIMPETPLDRQQPRDLVWIRQKFLAYDRLHPKIVVHGHTPTAEPELRANRVNVDTGAFATGVLTAFVVDGHDKTVMQVRG